MSIKSNISTLKIWLSEKVKTTYENKNQMIVKKLERNTNQILISKQYPKYNLLKPRAT